MVAGRSTYIYTQNEPNVAKYSIHGALGIGMWGAGDEETAPGRCEWGTTNASWCHIYIYICMYVNNKNRNKTNNNNINKDIFLKNAHAGIHVYICIHFRICIHTY